MPEAIVEDVGVVNGKLKVSWMTPTFDTRGVLIAIAEDAEFTVNRCIFMVPITSNAVLLTVGSGNWYVSVGIASGSLEKGIITWSTGIYGPVPIQTKDSRSVLADIRLPVLHSKSVENGYRIYTGKADPHVVIFEKGLAADVGTRFPLVKTTWKWFAEKAAMGWVECLGMNYPETYALRASTFEGGYFPQEKIVLLGQGRVFSRIVSSRTPFYSSGEAYRNVHIDSILLHQRKTDRCMKFTSHGDYLRYQAALTRSGDDKARTVGPTHYSEAEAKADLGH
jgi:hypothetical protein